VEAYGLPERVMVVVDETIAGRLAEKLNYLFAHHTLREVTISQSYIWQLRRSKRDNPTMWPGWPKYGKGEGPNAGARLPTDINAAQKAVVV
jgi:hypothetical protein